MSRPERPRFSDCDHALRHAWAAREELSRAEPLRCFYAVARFEMGLPASSAPPPAESLRQWLAGRPLNAADPREMSLIHFEMARLVFCPEAFERLTALLAAGAHPNAFWPKHASALPRRAPLTRAASEGLLDAARLLLAHGALPDGPPGSPFPPPIFCAASDSFRPGMIELLIEAGANPNASTQEGFTALHAAAIFNRPEPVAALVRAGADCDRLSGPTGGALTPRQIGVNREGSAFLAALEAVALERHLGEAPRLGARAL